VAILLIAVVFGILHNTWRSKLDVLEKKKAKADLAAKGAAGEQWADPAFAEPSPAEEAWPAEGGAAGAEAWPAEGAAAAVPAEAAAPPAQ